MRSTRTGAVLVAVMVTAATLYGVSDADGRQGRCSRQTYRYTIEVSASQDWVHRESDGDIVQRGSLVREAEYQNVPLKVRRCRGYTSLETPRETPILPATDSVTFDITDQQHADDPTPWPLCQWNAQLPYRSRLIIVAGVTKDTWGFGLDSGSSLDDVFAFYEALEASFGSSCPIPDSPGYARPIYGPRNDVAVVGSTAAFYMPAPNPYDPRVEVTTLSNLPLPIPGAFAQLLKGGNPQTLETGEVPFSEDGSEGHWRTAVSFIRE